MMTTRRIVLASIIATTCGWSARGETHHFFAPEYERDTRATITGRVVSVAYENPHASFTIAIEGQNETWQANTVGIRGLPDRGWDRDTIKIGQHVAVEGFIGRSGARRIWIQRIELGDGGVIYPVGRERATAADDAGATGPRAQ